jgi:pimeloyl-ACP methyl ester carboxylesterase
LHVVELGAESAPPVLLVHGFPEFWWCWRHQMPALAAAGLRAVAPDLRGYHHSTKPRGVGAYRIDHLAADLAALLDDLGPGAHPVVAHDWGAAVAWWAALVHAERISRLAILNVPHPAVFRRTLRRSREQRRRSRYMLYFQLPWLPERKLSRHGFRALRSMLRRTSRPGTFGEDELERYARAAAVPGALTAMLNWYRALLRRAPPRPRSWIVEPPVRIVWGTQDVALGEEMLAPSAELCRRVDVHRLPEAGHWLHHEEPARVNELLLDFLAP